MKIVKLVFSPRSPFSRLMTADQLWGQMVWAVSDLDGEESAGRLVSEFKSTPPFLVSAMMPNGFMYRPCLPPVTPDCSVPHDVQREERQKAKSNKSMKWLSVENFAELQKNPVCINSISFEASPELHDRRETHVGISRLDLSAIDGQLFNVSYKSSESELVCYIKLLRDEERYLKLVERTIALWEKVNLGGDRNVGRGVFRIRLDELDASEKAVFDRKASGFMTLCRCSGDDLVPLRYTLSVYAGIVGCGINSGNNQTYYNKKPVVGFEPGSVFSSGMGSLVCNVNTDDRVCTYSYAFPIPFDL